MESHLYEPIDIGYVPSLEIETALANLDGERVWRAAQPGYPLEDYYDAVRAHTFNRTVTKFRGAAVSSIYNSAMYLLPVIVDPEFLRAQEAGKISLSTVSTNAVTSDLGAWSPSRSTVALIRELMNYTQVANFEPVHFRSLLNQFGLHQPSTHTHQEEISVESPSYSACVPEDFPTLHFLCGVLTRENAMPAIPADDAKGSFELTKNIERSLRFDLTGNRYFEDCLCVLTPEGSDQAIETGVKAWLTALHRKYQFGRWDAAPSGGDRVNVVVELENAQEAVIAIPLRTYQLGVKGIERVIQHVGSLGSGVFDRVGQSLN